MNNRVVDGIKANTHCVTDDLGTAMVITVAAQRVSAVQWPSMMALHRFSCCIVFLACMLVGGWARAQGDEIQPASVAGELKNAAIPANAVGIFVQGVESSTPLLAMRADVPMNPASTMKLVTTFAGLEIMGPSFTWRTPIGIAVSPHGDILDGDLYIKGAGDPKLVFENLWLMLRQVRARGIREIRGNFVIDRSLFDSGADDPSLFDGEPFRPYNVGPDAFLVNFKSITLYFVPDDSVREVRVFAEPHLYGQQIGTLPYLSGPCGDWKARVAADFSHPDQILFAGGFPGSCGEKSLNVSLYSHAQYVALLVRQIWADLGGTLRGVVRDGSFPANARTLYELESPSLAEVVRDINKFSNNVMARQLFLSIAATQLKQAASPELAQKTIKLFLAEHGLNMPDLVIENGSGLSRDSRMSAQDMGRLLMAAWRAPVMPEFIASLPLVGYDGTMRKRLVLEGIAGRAHVKTGTLADTQAIAGYVLAASGKRYVVVMFVNHANAAMSHSAQDALLEWVYRTG